MFKFFRRQRDDMLEETGKSKIYKFVNLSSIIGLFVSVGLLVLMITKIFPWNSTLVGIIAGIVIICTFCNLALPWVVKIEKKEFIKLSYIFIGLIVLCGILWLICDILIISKYKQIKYTVFSDLSDEESLEFIKGIIRTLNFVKISIVISLQFSVASFIATYITRFKKSMLLMQAISYVCFLIVDLWTTLFMFSINVKSNFNETSKLGDILTIRGDLIDFLVRKGVLVALLLAVLYLAISKSIMNKAILNKRVKNIASETIEETSQKQKEPEDETTERLAKLKNMLDKNLISQEEYDKKRQDIIDKF